MAGLLLLTACSEPVQRPLGSTRLGEVCRIDHMDAGTDSAVNGDGAGADSGHANSPRAPG